jgi:acetyl-CoA carboxylase carboxyltransferase component
MPAPASSKRLLDDRERLTERAGSGNLYRGAEKLARQHKMFVRDRIALLCDKESFVEDGLLANAVATDLPADGVITGVGPVEGRRGRTVEKIVRLTEFAPRHELAVFWLVDWPGPASPIRWSCSREMGGARMHATVSGCGDNLAVGDADAPEQGSTPVTRSHRQLRRRSSPNARWSAYRRADLGAPVPPSGVVRGDDPCVLEA